MKLLITWKWQIKLLGRHFTLNIDKVLIVREGYYVISSNYVVQGGAVRLVDHYELEIDVVLLSLINNVSVVLTPS